MAQQGGARALRAAVAVVSLVAARPALAQNASVAERLERLERLVEGLVARLDPEAKAEKAEAAKAETAKAEAAKVADQKVADQKVADGAAADEKAALREEGATLLGATRELKDRQAELAELIAVPQKQESQGFRVGNTVVSYAGYVKLDAFSQSFSGGRLPIGAFQREFLFPSAIPIGGDPSGFDTEFSARQSRFIFTTATDVGESHVLKSHIELDFIVTEGGNKRITNSFVPRLRQGFITYDNWLFGQAWSTFQNLRALPDTVDFIGITPGTVFNRQPMIRWSKKGWSLALESPTTVVTTRNGGLVEGDNDLAPDFVVRKDYMRPWGHITATGIARMLRVGNDVIIPGGDTAFGYGLSVSGRVNFGNRDNIRFMASAGSGIGRYIGVNLVNDAALTDADNLNPFFTYSGFAAYQHFWGKRLRSTIAGSYFKADNPVAFTTTQVTDTSWNGLTNIIWNPVDPLDIGLEVIYAERTLEDGRTGNLQRIQFSTRYNF